MAYSRYALGTSIIPSFYLIGFADCLNGAQIQHHMAKAHINVTNVRHWSLHMAALAVPVVMTSKEISQLTISEGGFILLDPSDEYKYAEDQIALKATSRIDINVHSLGDTTNAGPFVSLVGNASTASASAEM